MYREQLKKIDELGFSVYRLVVANEVDFFSESYDIKLSDKDFDVICDLCYSWTTETSCKANEIVDCVLSLLSDKTITMNDFDDYYKITNIINDNIDRFC